MKHLFSFAAFFAFTLFSSSPTAFAQNRQPTGTLSPAEVNRIVQAFSIKETQFRQALNQYSFKRDAVVQTIGMGGQISGEYHRVSRFVFGDNGERYEKIVFFPISTLKDLLITPEDLEDLSGVQPFALEASKIGLYNFTYVGKERIDELDLYVFDVTPKVIPDPKKINERFFQGRIWVDDRDLQIVKARGKGVPEGKQRFPTFETYREQIDGKFWFPTYTYADDKLVFPNGQVIHVRMRVRYEEFQRARGEVRVIEEGDIVDDPPADTTPPPRPTPTPPPSRTKP